MLRLVGWYDDMDRPTLLTFWSAVHFMTGAVWHVLWRLLIPSMSFPTAFLVGNLLHAAYETKDFLLTYTTAFNPGRWLRGRPDAGKDENTLQNSMVDHVVAIVGFLVAARLQLASWWFLVAYLAVLMPVVVLKRTGVWYTD